MGAWNVHNPKEYMENALIIRTKDGKLMPLKMKPAQDLLYDVIREEHRLCKPIRIVVLKARQLGTSTGTEGMMFQDAATRPLVQTLIVAHRDDSTANLFRMNKLFYDCLPRELRPMKKASNAKELVFENPTKDPKKKKRNPGLRSRIRCVTAGGGGIGRSDTLTNVHISEYAFWPGNKKETLIGILQAVPDDPNTMVIMESTPNGFNEFKEFWDDAVAGKNGFRPLFIAWFSEPEYRRPVPSGTVWTDEEKKLAETWGLDEEQLAWRRWCIATNLGGDENLFRQEYPSTPDEAFLFSGDPFFDNDVVMSLRQSATPTKHVGSFAYATEDEGGVPKEIKWKEDEKAGFIRIWEEPKEGVPYVLGGDTAGEGSDCFTAWVIDNTTGKQVAELQYPFSEILYARQIWCLGRYYNWAMAAIEVNFSTYPEMKLEEWHYPSLYQRERYDTFSHKMVKAFGWATTSKTRPVALAGLHTVMEETPENVVSWWTLGEMLTFVYDKSRSHPEAVEGEHDDLVLAAAICHAARGQQRMAAEKKKGKKVHWTDDQWEDYRSADEVTRRKLIELWGEPD